MEETTKGSSNTDVVIWFADVIKNKGQCHADGTDDLLLGEEKDHTDEIHDFTSIQKKRMQEETEDEEP